MNKMTQVSKIGGFRSRMMHNGRKAFLLSEQHLLCVNHHLYAKKQLKIRNKGQSLPGTVVHLKWEHWHLIYSYTHMYNQISKLPLNSNSFDVLNVWRLCVLTQDVVTWIFSSFLAAAALVQCSHYHSSTNHLCPHCKSFSSLSLLCNLVRYPSQRWRSGQSHCIAFNCRWIS